MTDYVARYKLVFRDLASRNLLRVSNVARGLTTTLARAGRAATGLSAAAIAVGSLVNNATAERERLARSVNVSQQQLGAVATIAKQIGLNYENVVDLAEEMNNKVGEMMNLGEMTSLQEGLKGLGLTFKDIKDLAPEQQFERMLDAATKLGNVQVASASLDMIFGGEASKLTGALVVELDRLGLSYADFLLQQRQLNNLTTDGVEGAIKYRDSLAKLSKFSSTLAAQAFGILGGALSPVVERLNEFLIANKEEINFALIVFAHDLGAAISRIDFTAVASGIAEFGRGVGAVVGIARDVVEAVGGMENVLIGLAGAWAVGKVAGFITSLGVLAKFMTGPLGIAMAGIVTAGTLIYQNWEAISEWADRMAQRVEAAWQKVKDAVQAVIDLIPEINLLADSDPNYVPPTAGRGNFRAQDAAQQAADSAAQSLEITVKTESEIDVNGGGQVRSNRANVTINDSGSTFPIRRGGRSGQIGAQ